MAVKQLIERIELDSSASSITFSSIPQDYAHLVILHSSRSFNSVVDRDIFLFANSVSDAHDTVRLVGNGGSVSSDSQANDFMRVAIVGGANSTANTFTNGQIYISNYTSSANKSVSTDSVMENNDTTAFQLLTANLINVNSPLTSITLDANFVAGSTFSLYGITRGGSGTVTTS